MPSIRRTRPAALPLAGVAVSALLASCNRDVQGATTFDSEPTTTATPSETTDDPTTETPGDTSTTNAGADTSTTTAPAESSSSSEGSSEDGSGTLCGDGEISGTEECDCAGLACTLDGLGDMQCPDVKDPNIPGPITGGVLGCNPASCRFDTSACTYCGDGLVLGDLEECEPKIEIETSCNEIGEGTAGALACNADCTLDTTACTDCGYQFYFDGADCAEGFTSGAVQGGTSTWECGDPTAYNLGPGIEKTGMWATNLSGPYASSETSAITSPVLDLSACGDRSITMSMHHFHNFEGGVINADGAIVQVSEDGSSWTTIAPSGGSDYGPNALDATGSLIDGDPGFSGNLDDNMWVDTQFDLTDYVGSDSLQVRFVFGSNANNNQGGWYIDRIELLGSGG
jgi:hypothetical protein